MDKATSKTLYHGLAQAIIRSKENATGHITVKAKSNGFKPITITIPVKQADHIPFVPEIVPELILDKWLLSPMVYNRPDPNKN